MAFAAYRPLYSIEGYDATVIAPAEVLRRMAEGPMWIATDGAAVVGTVSGVEKSDSLYIRGMAVHPAARGRKLGERLIATVEDFATHRGITRLFLSTTPFLERAIRLYEKAEFRRVTDGPHDFFGTPLFTMVKILRPRT